MALRILAGGVTLRLDKDGPARTEPSQSVVQPAGDADEFRRHCRIQIRPTKPCRALERAILVEDNALVDQSGPGQEIRQMRYGSTILSEVHHAHVLKRRDGRGYADGGAPRRRTADRAWRPRPRRPDRESRARDRRATTAGRDRAPPPRCR